MLRVSSKKKVTKLYRNFSNQSPAYLISLYVLIINSCKSPFFDRMSESGCFRDTHTHKRYQKWANSRKKTKTKLIEIINIGKMAGGETKFCIRTVVVVVK